MNGGRAAKRLLAVVLALGTLVTLGLYYNGGQPAGGSGGRVAVRPPPPPQPAAFARRTGGVPADPSSNGVAAASSAAGRGPRPSPRRRPVMAATVDRDTCPELGSANTTVDTVAQFSRFEFQVG